MRINNKFNTSCPVTPDPGFITMVVDHINGRSELCTTTLNCYPYGTKKHIIQNTLKYSVILLLASERPLLLRIPSKRNDTPHFKLSTAWPFQWKVLVACNYIFFFSVVSTCNYHFIQFQKFCYHFFVVKAC